MDPLTELSQTESPRDTVPSIRFFRVGFYALWLVIAACAVGMFLAGSRDIAVGLLVGLGFMALGLIEFERFAKRVPR